MLGKPRTQLFRIKSEVDAVLRTRFGKALWNVNIPDSCRLVKLKMWEEKYCVSLDYILKTLLPWAWHALPKQARDKAKHSKGLGTKIAVITSASAERFLKEKIREDYHDEENIAITYADKREAIIHQLSEESLPAKPKKVLSYKRVSDFVTSYADRIARKKTSIEKVSRVVSRMPYRNNPFR